jgi:hypothetical protein
VVWALVTGEADENKDGVVSTDELRTYVEAEVPKLTDGKQHPTVDRDNLDLKFGFPAATPAHGASRVSLGNFAIARLGQRSDGRSPRAVCQMAKTSRVSPTTR